MDTDVNGMFKISLKMNVFLFSLVICVIAAPYDNAADSDIYPDLPDEYFIEQINRLQSSGQLQRLQAADSYPDGNVEQEEMEQESSVPDFTFQYPPGADTETSEFAVRPPDQRYYHDTRQQLTPQVNTEDILKPSLRQALDDDTFEPPRLIKSSTSLPTLNTNEDAGDDAQTEDESLFVDSGTHAQIIQTPVHMSDDKQDVYFIAIVAGCSAAAVVLVLIISISWYKLQRNAKAAADVEYPAYGVTGPNKDTSPTGDRKLAQSAQMYHYQHQKQQIIAMENRVASERNGSMSEAESDEDNEEGDYTVYECPGLAPTGEMEVKNPLFHDDPTPATHTPTNQNTGSTCSPVDQINTNK